MVFSMICDKFDDECKFDYEIENNDNYDSLDDIPNIDNFIAYFHKSVTLDPLIFTLPMYPLIITFFFWSI